MGLIEQGILGGFRKKTGTVVGAFWRKQAVIKALPRTSSKPPTQSQLDQQLKFGLVTAFLSDISDLIDVGFYSPSSTSTPMNNAVSYHLKEAIIGTSPNFSFNVDALRYSEGKLALPYNVTATETGANEITFTWDRILEQSKLIDPSDKVTFLVYNADKKSFVSAVNVVDRSVGEYIMQLPLPFAGDTVHVYLSYSSATSKKLKSDSKMVATITLAP